MNKEVTKNLIFRNLLLNHKSIMFYRAKIKMKKLNLPHIQNQKLHQKDLKTIKLFLTLRQSLKLKSR